MSAPRPPRFAAPARSWSAAIPPAPRWADRLLQSLGVQPAFAEAILGDLAEERVLREEQRGRIGASVWYASELLSALPHLFWNAARFGTPVTRARLSALVASMVLVMSAALMAFVLRDGPPARLVFTHVSGAESVDGIVVNYMRPVQLPTQVLDAKGHTLETNDVRYQWASGAPVRVSSTGTVTCTTNGDATVRASIATVTTDLLVHCRPVRELRMRAWMTLTVDDSVQELPFIAVGPDGRLVNLIAGALRVHDSSVATLTGSRIRPIMPGHTMVSVHVGDSESRMEVSVFRWVPTLDHLRPADDLVIAPVHLPRGTSIQWVMPKGSFWLEYKNRGATRLIPRMEVDGPISCMHLETFAPEVVRISCITMSDSATFRMTNPDSFMPLVEGSLSLERQPIKRDVEPRPSPQPHPSTFLPRER